ncbi:MFS transporter [Herpetosiphon geysericola]|uniref:MFS transporter n=1 Tax=Herpetosiphon geysericola TaxID=70996 RepID=A0A0P6YCC4_9CHLR|nr:MFS transporter [Herpetosiphon geysericola]KPL90966.1 MFS transporter [Herpetosiphon geysericola]
MSYSVPSLRRHSTLLVGLAYAAFISLGLPDGLTGVAWPSVRAEFGLPLDALGALITSGTLGYLISSFSSGRVLAKIGVGWLLVLSCLATAVSLLGYGYAPAWLFMASLGILAGLGAGAIDAGLNTYAAENFNPRMLNWLHASFGLGAASGPVIMSSIISANQSWRLGYVLVGIAQLLLASAFAITRKQWQTNQPETMVEPVASASMLQTLRLPVTWLNILLFFLYTGLEFCAGQWLYTLLTISRGMEPGIAGVWVSIYWGSLTVGRLLSGVIVGRMSVVSLLRLSMLVAILGVVLFWLNLAPWLTVIGIALLGLALAPMFPSFIALTPARMGPRHSANTIGFQIAAATLGGASIASSFGLFADLMGIEVLGTYLFVVAVAMALIFEALNRLKPAV